MEDLKKSYINAMRGVTSTVSIISAKEDGERHAMTATSVTSLSLDPPAMLVCVNKEQFPFNLVRKIIFGQNTSADDCKTLFSGFEF